MLNEIKDKFNDLTEGLTSGSSNQDNPNQRNQSGIHGSTSGSSARYGSSQGQGDTDYGSSQGQGGADYDSSQGYSNGGSNYGSGRSNYGSGSSNYGSGSSQGYGSGSSQGHGSSTQGGYSRYGSSHEYGSTPRYRSSSDYSHSDDSSSGNSKVWIAALAGASAGLIAGMLLAPETGRETRQSLKRSVGNWGGEIDKTVKSVFGKAEDEHVTGTGSSLKMKGNWNDIKGNLKQQYGQLTDDDLNYEEGREDAFVGNLQRKLGKTKREIYDMLGIDNKNS